MPLTNHNTACSKYGGFYEKKLKWTLPLAIIIILALHLGTLKSSPIHNVPVPITAKLETNHNDTAYTYSYYGINRLYLKFIEGQRVARKDQMGALHTFEKDGNRVGIITFQDGFSISEE
ncbi:hypothetical protein [Alkalihalobacterium bogoriense]|uniref:hypothetical protein n=1 Tax=Alkalihalobacterium bogoriense TaxID=246272 RepID=UPI00047D79F1|nr:hypothetical protein [Alkalihalobacterium bogoriense]